MYTNRFNCFCLKNSRRNSSKTDSLCWFYSSWIKLCSQKSDSFRRDMLFRRSANYLFAEVVCYSRSVAENRVCTSNGSNHCKLSHIFILLFILLFTLFVRPEFNCFFPLVCFWIHKTTMCLSCVLASSCRKPTSTVARYYVVFGAYTILYKYTLQAASNQGD